MAIKRFSEYVKDNTPANCKLITEQPFCKTLSIEKDGMEVCVNILLSRHEQHRQVIRFLRRVADELEILETSTKEEL